MMSTHERTLQWIADYLLNDIPADECTSAERMILNKVLCALGRQDEIPTYKSRGSEWPQD